MTFTKMILVSLKNIKANFKVSVIYGMLIPLLMMIILPMPKVFASVFSFGFMIFIPVFSSLPLIIAYTKPSPEGPFTFKDRFNFKKVPFIILSLIVALLSIFFSLFFAFIISLLETICILFFARPQFILLLLSVPLLIGILFITVLIDSVKHFIYIAYATENIKISTAIYKGIKLFFRYPFKNLLQYLLFSVIISIIPAVIFILLIPHLFTSIVSYYLVAALVFILSAIVNPFISSFMVELYRKNILIKE